MLFYKLTSYPADNGLYNNTTLCQEIPVEDTVTQKKQSVSLLDVNIS